MKITDYLAEPQAEPKKIELIYCFQTYPADDVTDAYGRLVPYFYRTEGPMSEKNRTELRRIGQIQWGENPELFDIIQDFREVPTGHSILWLGHWNDGVV